MPKSKRNKRKKRIVRTNAPPNGAPLAKLPVTVQEPDPAEDQPQKVTIYGIEGVGHTRVERRRRPDELVLPVRNDNRANEPEDVRKYVMSSRGGRVGPMVREVPLPENARHIRLPPRIIRPEDYKAEPLPTRAQQVKRLLWDLPAFFKGLAKWVWRGLVGLG